MVGRRIPVRLSVGVLDVPRMARRLILRTDDAGQTETDEALPVGQAAVRDHLGEPRGSERFARLDLSRRDPFLPRQSGREEESDPLVRESRGGEEGGELAPRFGYVSGLLPQLALRARKRLLVRLELPGGNLPQFGSNGVAVLPNEKDVAVRKDGDDRYGTGVYDDLPRTLCPVRRLDPIDVDVEKAPAEDVLVRNDAERFRRRRSPP